METAAFYEPPVGGRKIVPKIPENMGRKPPSIEELSKVLNARIAQNGQRNCVETIGIEHSSCSCRKRRERSLKHCHLPTVEKPRHPAPRESGAYVPELSARLDHDRNLTDGARRCARKLAEYIYRKNRDGREAQITVSYLVKSLGRCRRTVQRYLRQLEREGYITVYVLPSERTRMCFGLLVGLLSPLLPQHRRFKWPEKSIVRGVTAESHIHRQRYNIKPIKRSLWAFYCCEGVWRSYQRSKPPLLPFPATA